MANEQRLCYTMTKVPDHYVRVVRVPEGMTMYPGQMVSAEVVDTGIDGNFQVRVPSAPTADNIKTDIMGIVVNGGFENLPDGRRPDGQPDFTKYNFIAGEVATIIWLLPKVMVYISDDCVVSGGLTGDDSDVGKFITPTATNMTPTGTETKPAAGAVKSYCKIFQKKATRSGGMFGAGFISGNVCEVVNQ